VTGPPSADRRGTARARELADQIIETLGQPSPAGPFDDNELDELAYGG
jgi:hypothetical protein